MNEADIKNKFSKVLIAVLGIARSLAEAPESRFNEDLNADSLDGVEIVMACEEEFNITILDGEYDHIQTVAQALDFLKTNTAPSPGACAA